MSLLVTASVNTYQIKWYPDSLFNLFVVNLKTYPPTPLLLFYRLHTAYCVHVLVYSLNTASVFDLFSDLPKEELPMTGRDGQQHQWQKSHNVLSLRPAKDKERHGQIIRAQTMNTIAPLWRFGDCDVTTSVMS